MTTRTLVQLLASTVQARRNCEESGNTEWFHKHSDLIEQLVKDHMPSGGGFDSGTSIDLAKSDGDKLVFNTAYHHMHESGMYDGWTEHTVTVKPAFVGISLVVSGRDRNEIKDYIAECFHNALDTVQS